MTAGESAERKVKVAATAHLKFSAVLGTVSAKSSIFMRPALCPPMDTSKNTTGFPLASPGMEPTPDMATRSGFAGARRGERTEPRGAAAVGRSARPGLLFFAGPAERAHASPHMASSSSERQAEVVDLTADSPPAPAPAPRNRACERCTLLVSVQRRGSEAIPAAAAAAASFCTHICAPVLLCCTPL